jgi:hypothetical protein
LSRGFSKISAKIFEGFATYLQPIAVGCDFGYPCGVATFGNRPSPLDIDIISYFKRKVKRQNSSGPHYYIQMAATQELPPHY